ncbi:MAG: transglutaminase-like putative cysteine protease [Halioglobus sp.]|jgi:transglutaminase-like putative cysteine protease
MRHILLWSLCLFALPCSAAADEHRSFQFTYEIESTDFPVGKAVDIYIPLPVENEAQQILGESIQSSHPGKKGQEEAYGNTYYHIHRPASNTEPLSATLSWTVNRKVLTANGKGELSDARREQFLGPNSLVPVGHEILKPILEEIHQMRGDDSPQATARAIYDWVVDNVEYKKVGSGWGNGDTFWACNERYGNCTDFHALFISLARSEGIPARFEIGFPVPMDRDSGSIGGYHCWVQFYLPELGWVPIDASEAAKHPEQRELLYGSHPANRIHFTTGRDLVLSSDPSGNSLNYFIYPHVEIDGEVYGKKIATRFSFEEILDAP